MTTASTSPSATDSEATRALKHGLDQPGLGSQGRGRPRAANEPGLPPGNIVSDLETSSSSRVWAHRPRPLHLGVFIAVYVLGCGFAQSLAIVPGTGISIWPPSGLFIATLLIASRYSWPWWMMAACVAELTSNLLWFHTPLPAAFLIYTGNALEAVAGAWLVNRTCKRPLRLETLQEVLAFVVLAAGIAPVASATVGSATLAWFGIQSQSFAAAWPLWWIGDATGVLIVAPLALVVFQNWRGKARLSAARWIEAGVLGLIFLGVAALSLSGYLPFAYIIMPPLLWAAVRFEFRGAAVALILLALITAVFTVSGASQFAGDPGSQRNNQIMLQLFLVISAFSALIVAAISRQHQQAVLTLHESVEALRRSEQQLQQMIDAVPVRIWSAVPTGGPAYFNKRYQDHFRSVIANFEDLGEPRIDELLQKLIHPEDAPGVQCTLSNSFETGDGSTMRFRWLEKDGSYRWAECRVEPRRDENGAVVQWYGVSLDVDDEVRAQEALRESERRLQQLIDTVPALIWSTTREGTPSYVNKRFTDVTGATLSDIIAPDGSPSLSVIHPDDIDTARQAIRHSFATGVPYVQRYRQRRAKGNYRWTETRAEALRDEDGHILQWYGVSVDIHDLVTTQAALHNREQALSQLVNMVPSYLWRLSSNGEPTFFNKRLIDFLGLDITDAEMPDTNRLAAFIATVVHPDDAPSLREALNSCFATGERFFMKYRLRRADGVYRWMEGQAEPLRDESGRIVQWYGLTHDIDDQLRVEEALRERERALWQLVETLPAMIDCAAPDGEPMYRSQQLREFLGYNLEELDEAGKSRLAGTLEAGVHADDLAGVKERYAHSLTTGEPYARRHRLRRFDGEYRWVETRAAPMRNTEGAIVQWNVICLDIENEVRAQEQLRLAQERLARASQAASLAELSASIAHEVNQPLAAIVANSNACHRWLSAEPPNLDRAKITAERIIRDANSAADVVGRIRALFRPSLELRTSTPIPSVIDEARDLMAEEATRCRVRMDIDVERNLPLVAFDRVQIQQVLVNLIRNGIEAMHAIADDKVLGMRVRRTGDTIQIEVSDSGPGVEHPDKIFDPFFTTKGQGMGMGLAISRSIIESHGGRLWAENRVPHGARFVFTLPVEAKAAP
ncbi:PAS domain-containing protein [Mesorhizobium sp. M0152]|uniref:PAS domain-containing protein n=1 Tax=Mesorhizobium sp. M0152 TaxID=2956898 RepID=UPI0033363018